MEKIYRRFKNFINIARGVEYARRYEYLFDAIRENNYKRITEIGTWNGERALEMIETAKKYHKAEEIEYYGFDLFDIMTEEIFKEEVSKRPPSQEYIKGMLEKTGAKIYLYKGFTKDTMPQVVSSLPEMDLIFIDGGHHIDTIRNDWYYSQQVMNDNTIVIFDDYWSGEWGKRKDTGCQSLIVEIDRSKFNVEILPIQDSFKKDWGILKINFAKVTRNGHISKNEKRLEL
jgi:hypothetical protein